jgi:hypothetical protein
MFNFVNNPASSTPEYQDVDNTIANGLTTDQPFMILVRGGRDMDLNITNQQLGNETILRFTGELATGTQSLTAAASQLNADVSEFNGIANPYQAQVNLGQLLLNNATDIQTTKAWIFDPTNADTFGAYVLVEFDGSGNFTTATPQGTSTNAGDVNGFLQPNQSFFVQNASTGTPSPTLDFEEVRKSNNTTTTTVFSTTPNQDLSVQLNLYSTDEDDLRDGVIIRMGDNFTDAVTDEDAVKFWNYLESLATVQNGAYLTSDRRLLDEENEIVQLYLTNYTNENYTFKINVDNPENKTVHLVDHYLGTQTLLDNNYLEYNFSVNQNVPASSDTDRFQLNFDNTTLSDGNFELNGLNVYPNPVVDIFTVNLDQFNGQVIRLNIFDITGKKVQSFKPSQSGSVIEISMNGYSNGVYILKVDTSNGQLQKKLIKQ